MTGFRCTKIALYLHNIANAFSFQHSDYDKGYVIAGYLKTKTKTKNNFMVASKYLYLLQVYILKLFLIFSFN